MNDYSIHSNTLVKCSTCNYVGEKVEWMCLPVANNMYDKHGFGHMKDCMFFLYGCPKCGTLRVITDEVR